MRIAALALFVLVVIPLCAVVQETGSLENFLLRTEPGCAYDQWVTHVSEGLALPGYNVYAPWDRQTNGFGSFALPTVQDTSNWSAISTAFVANDWHSLDLLLRLSHYPYDLVELNDNGHSYYMLRERLNRAYDDNGTADTSDDENGSFDYGWGLYIVNPASTSNVIVTVVHPNDDFIAVAVAVKAFQTLGARYLMINGAGREVAYNSGGGYYNGASLSDPSRNAMHPYNLTYQKACNQIRSYLLTQPGLIKREFSLQVHSYDSEGHIGYSNIQVSCGTTPNGPNPAALPVWDMSLTQTDMINQAGYTIHPAGSIGINNTVLTTDFWAVYATNVYYHDATQNLPISTAVDLPAYGQNKQMQYTLANYNEYDVFDPFLHVELDELPDSYLQNEAIKKWFYGFNENTGWNLNARYDNVVAYYLPFIQALNASLINTMQMQDTHVPAVTQITDVQRVGNRMHLFWNRIYEYDFSTWMVKLDKYIYHPNGTSTWVDSTVYTRNDYHTLAAADRSYLFDLPVEEGFAYRISVGSSDMHGNFSGYSEVVEDLSGVITPELVALEARPELSDDMHIGISWQTQHTPVPVVAFHIRKRLWGEHDWQDLGTVGVEVHTFIDSVGNANPQQVWDYHVIVEGSDGYLYDSNVICSAAVRVYPATDNVWLERAGDGSLMLVWNPVQQNMAGMDDFPDYYEIITSAMPDMSGEQVIYSSVDTFMEIDPIAVGQRSFYQVRAKAAMLP